MGKKSKLSKRYGLSKIDPFFREKIFASIQSERFKLAVAVLAATGCRPAEIELGVAIGIRDGFLTIGILGVKVDPLTKRGQPKRLISIDSDTPWGSYLSEQVSNSDNKGLVVSYNKDSLSQRIREKSKSIWPRQKSLVSAYSFRHFVGKSMKESGEDVNKIAATLGHASDYSQSAYGRAGGKKRSNGKHGILKASASNPIRHSPKTNKLSNMIIRQTLSASTEN